MKFTLEIELDDEAELSSRAVTKALDTVADEVTAVGLVARAIYNDNGDIVGKWEVTANDHAYNGYPDGSACFTCGAKRTAEAHQ